MNKKYKIYLMNIGLIVLALLYATFFQKNNNTNNSKNVVVDTNSGVQSVSAENLPKYMGKAYVAVNGNKASFTEEELKGGVFEKYSNLDKLGRCGVADAIIGVELMPKEKRESIYEVKPTGWKSIRDEKIDGGSLYNRCHLIAFKLAGENANEKNLITGTRYMNTEGMGAFEDLVTDYVRETKKTVRYRVKPIFVENELVARGVQMEAYSIEDGGKAINFNVYCFNVQPGYEINYKTGHAKKY